MAAIANASEQPSYPVVTKKQTFVVTNASAANGDTCVTPSLTTIQGAIGFCTTAGGTAAVGDPAMFTFSGATITINNASTGAWTFFAWGV